MDKRDESRSVLELVNLARVAYGAPELKSLLRGQPRSASFCTIGRSLRSGVEDWLFIAVGSKHLRLWACGKDSAALAQLIMATWGMPGHPLPQSQVKSSYVTFELPAVMREFVDQFDRGLLPDYRGDVGQSEIHRLNELARAMPLAVGRGNRAGGSLASGRHSTANATRQMCELDPARLPSAPKGGERTADRR